MKILLAEDDPSIQAIAEMALTRIGHHEVRTSHNGVDTLKVLETYQPDVILLDVMMPTLNGFDTCAILKGNPKTAHIPVIFLSARVQNNEVQKGMNLGAVGYIAKPFDPMNFCNNIEEILRKNVAA